MSDYDWDSHNTIYQAAKWLPEADVHRNSWGTWFVLSRPDGNAMPSLVCAGPDTRLLCEMLTALREMGWEREEE